MPELLTHSLIGLAGRQLARRRSSVDPLLLVGCCLPDWISHAHVVWPALYEPVGLLHEPIPVTIAAALWATFLRKGSRIAGWGAICLGALLHYAADLMQAHAFPAYFPLFPLSDRSVDIGWFPVEGSLWIAPLLALLVLTRARLSGASASRRRPTVVAWGEGTRP
jgi:hypothetical protein